MLRTKNGHNPYSRNYKKHSLKKNKSAKLIKRRTRDIWSFPWIFAFMALAVSLASFLVIGQKPGSRTAHADPFSPACEPHGYLFQYENQNPPNTPPTNVSSVDLITNVLKSAGTIDGRTVNAVGYNVVDNFMYGWDNTTPRTLVRIHGDLSTADSLTVNGLPGGIPIVAAGDVDNNRQYWFVGGPDWHRIDLTGATPTYVNGGAVYGAGGPPANLPTGASTVADLAYVPPTFLNDNRAGMYTIVNHSGAPQLYRMDISVPLTPTWEHIGSLGAFMTEAEGVTGALYADALGVLYAGSNTGPLWRIIIGNSSLSIPLDAFEIANGPSANGNDGARCAAAYPPADFGDAPLSYGTRWEDVGPLHAVGNFDDANSEAPLMLGQKIDIEGIASDNFPDAAADGDDNDHNPPPPLDDEDSVQHIVAPPTPTALAVPVTVTNNSNSPATLAGWIDLDNSGTFDAGERVTKDIPLNSGQGVYELTFPEATLSTNTYARFRLFQGTGLDDSILQPNGLESAFIIGEVEDYSVQVGTFKVNKTADPPEGSDVTPGQTLTYTLDITNTGTTDLVDLTVHDDLSNVLDDATLEGDPVVNPTSAGTATLRGDKLTFEGDVPAGQTVTVTYKVKVKPFDQLGSKHLLNYVISAQSNCHPTINGAAVTAEHPDCNTTHRIQGLANTGSTIMTPLALAGGLIVSGGAVWTIATRLRWAPGALGRK